MVSLLKIRSLTTDREEITYKNDIKMIPDKLLYILIRSGLKEQRNRPSNKHNNKYRKG